MKTPLERRNTHDQHLEGAAGFCAICASVWGLFAIYFLKCDAEFSANLCSVEACVTLFIALTAYSYPRTRRTVAVINVLVCAIGITVASIFSQLPTSTTLVLFCCLSMMAMRLLSHQSTLGWVLFSSFAAILIYVGFESEVWTTMNATTAMDNAIKLTGLVFIVALMVQQSRFSRDDGRQLAELTEVLDERTHTLSLAEEVAKIGHWRWDGVASNLSLSDEAKQICYLTENGPDVSLMAFLDRFVLTDSRRLEDALRRASTNGMSFEIDLSIRHEGVSKFVQCIGGPTGGGGSLRNAVFGVVKDVTESRNIQAELSKKANALYEMAEFDQLTGLANRYRFKRLLSEHAEVCNDSGTQMVLLMIDLDGFKNVNDTIGHAAGDFLLQEVAHRLSRVTRHDDVVARLGGDEFTVILESVGVDHLDSVTDKILLALKEPIFVEGKEVRLGASIGAAVFPDDATDKDELIAYADRAMYIAKGASESGVRIYESWMTEDVKRRRELEDRLATALENNEFRLAYQPQISSSTGNVCGVEALLRWENNGVPISPSEFVPLLETTGAIVTVGRWVLGEACRQAQRWRNYGYQFTMSVNVSPIQFNDRNFASDVLAALQESEFPAGLLDLEVTEGVLVDGYDKTSRKLQNLKDLGAHISIDDFGTGYSSLSYLKHLPIDRLKIDRAFVKDIPESDDGVIASTVILLAHSLGMTVLAEGVETVEQRDFLTSRSCNEFQGYFFSKPLSSAECLEFFRENAKIDPTIRRVDAELDSAAKAEAASASRLTVEELPPLLTDEQTLLPLPAYEADIPTDDLPLDSPVSI